MFSTGFAAVTHGQSNKIHIFYAAEMTHINQQSEGTYAQLAGFVNQTRQSGDPTFFLFGGDSLGPSALSAMDRGSHIIDLLNSIEPDVYTIGMREFSYFEDELTLRSDEAGFPMVSSNLFDPLSNSTLDGIQQSILINKGGFKLGVVSVIGQKAREKYALKRVVITDPVKAITQQANSLRTQGADKIILLYSSPIPVVDSLLKDGVINYALRKDEHFYIKTEQQTPQHPHNLVLTDSKSIYHLIITQTKGGDDFQALLLDTTQALPDPDVQALEESYDERMDYLLNVPVGRSTVEIDLRRAAVRQQENAFGNFVADAIRDYTGAQIALINSGTIRSDMVYPANTTFTRRDIANILPYRNRIVLMEVYGDQLLSALENGFSALEQAKGRFLQVSGLQVVYDSKAPVGSRLKEAWFKGKLLDPKALYQVVTLNYIADGGDAFDMFVGAQRLPYNRPESLLLSDVITDWFRLAQVISPSVDGRLRDIAIEIHP